MRANSERIIDKLHQEEIETAMLRTLSNSVGVHLHPKSVPLPGGGYLEIDGFSASPAVLCQVHSELGPMTCEQERIAMLDALKLSYAAGVLGNTARRILLFRDRIAARSFCNAPGVAEELGASGIEVCLTA